MTRNVIFMSSIEIALTRYPEEYEGIQEGDNYLISNGQKKLVTKKIPNRYSYMMLERLSLL